MKIDDCIKKQRLSNAQFRTEIASDLCIRQPLVFYTLGTTYICFVIISFIHIHVYNFVYIYIYMYIILYIYIYIERERNIYLGEK